MVAGQVDLGGAARLKHGERLLDLRMPDVFEMMRDHEPLAKQA